jgi:hypothetical protein
VPCRVTGEEDLVVDRGADLVRDPVALVADRVLAELGRQPDGRLLHVVARVERPDPDAQLVVGGEAPAVARGHVGAVDPELEVAARPMRVHLEPARERRLGRLVVVVGAENTAPAERVHDQRRGQIAPVGVHDDIAPRGFQPLVLMEYCSIRSQT